MSAPTKEEIKVSDAQRSKDGSKMDLDTIMKELGQFGPFQRRLMALCGVVGIFAAWSASEYLFTTARIPTRCLIPECESIPGEFSAPWVWAAVPEAGGVLDGCRRYASNASLAAPHPNCPADLFDRNTIEDCQAYVYENSDTIVYDYELACDEWRRTLIGSLRIIGTLFSMPLTGYISDRWGRRVALTLAALNCAWLGTVRYWAGTYVGFIVSEVVESAVGSGIYTSAYILLIEVMDIKYRTAASAAMMSSWAVGQMTLGLIAWAVPNWRNLTLTLYIPQFITITYFWVVTESARWYMSKGKFEKSKEVLQKIANANGKTLSQKSFEALQATAEEERQTQEIERKMKRNEPWLIVAVFRHKKVLLRCAVAPVWWITNTFIYYGLSINAVNMIGNHYLNYVAVSAVEIPGFWTAVFLINRIGRKPLLTGGFWICAACQVAYIFIPDDYYGLSLAFYLLGKYSIAMVAISLYIYTAELYPTRCRHSLFAFTSMVGRIGSIVAPLTPAFGAATFDNFPFVLFGSFALLSGVLMFLTPETLGTKLPDTMEEAEMLQQRTDRSNQTTQP